MLAHLKGSDKAFVEAFRILSSTAKTLVRTDNSLEETRWFIEKWQEWAEEAILTTNLSGLRLLVGQLRVLTDDFPQWQLLLCRYDGYLAWFNGEYADAYALFEQELIYARQQNDVVATIQALLDLAETSVAQSQFSKAEKLLMQGLELSQEYDLKDSRVKVLSRLGRLNHLQQLWKVAQDYLEEALILLRSHKADYNKVEEAFIFHWLGGNCTATRRWREAENFLIKSLGLSRQQRDILGIIETKIKLGALYYQLEQYDSATVCFEGSLAICEQLNYRPALLQAYYYKSLTYYTKRQYRHALNLAQKAVEIGLETEQKEWLPKAFFHLGQVHNKLKDAKLALSCHLKVAEFYQPGNKSLQWVELLVGVGDFLLDVRDQPPLWEQALDCYRYAVNIIEGHEKLDYLASILGKMGWAFTKINGLAGVEDATRCYRLQLRMAGNLDSTTFPAAVAVAIRVEALMGLQRCAALRKNQNYQVEIIFGDMSPQPV